MSVPLAHLHALAQRALDAHERRAGELRARLAPVLAAGMAGAALLSPDAVSAVRGGAALSAAVFLLTLAGGLSTIVTIGYFLGRRLDEESIQPRGVHHHLVVRGALDDEVRFHIVMIELLSVTGEVAKSEVDLLHREFTAIMCGILFVLCGLALTAVIAW